MNDKKRKKIKSQILEILLDSESTRDHKADVITEMILDIEKKKGEIKNEGRQI